VGILHLAESHVLLAAREQQQLFRDGANEGQTLVPRNSQLFDVKVGYCISFFGDIPIRISIRILFVRILKSQYRSGSVEDLNADLNPAYKQVFMSQQF
jgi:hypothetical protein